MSEGLSGGIQSHRIVLPALEKDKPTAGTGMGGAVGGPTPNS